MWSFRRSSLFPLCSSCRHELSVMGCPIWVQSTSVHQNSAETLGVRQSGVWETLAMLRSSAQLSPTHRSSWTASRRKVSSVLPEEKSRALALTATAMDYIYLIMYCTINLLFMDYRHAAKSHGKRSWFIWVYLCLCVCEQQILSKKQRVKKMNSSSSRQNCVSDCRYILSACEFLHACPFICL